MARKHAVCFRFGGKAGYDGAELDVQMTRDEQLVVVHDFVLNESFAAPQMDVG